MPKSIYVAALALLLASLTTSCFSRGQPLAQGKRTVYMTAVEYKGSAEVAKEPFPATKAEGAGYTLKEPLDGRWETSSYRWDPGSVVVYQGDQVELRIWGVNGDQHLAYLETYVPEFTVKRGELTALTFKADQPGIFRLVCTVHRPSMEAQVVVLPR